MYYLILTNFIFKTVDTPQQFHRYGINVVYAGAAVTVLKPVWKGMKWIGTAYYNWRKGKDKELQKELKKARESQTHVDMNDQFQARPPALNGQKVRVLSVP